MSASFDGFTYKTDDAGFIWHINNGKSEPYTRELSVVQKYLSLNPSKNNIFIDVGGHIGSCSLPYSRLFKQGIAYEPTRKNYTFFVENLALNKISNVIVHNKGCFNKTTSCVSVQHEGGNSGCFYIKEDKQNKDAIPVVKIDDELINNFLPVDFIKIDTEGSELYVLWGAYETIKRWKPLIQIETNGSSERYFNYSDSLCLDFLFGLGYKIFDTDGHNPFLFCPE
jgi:FkbM family methyltransferase